MSEETPRERLSREDAEATDKALGSERKVHHEPRSFASEQGVDDALEQERRNLVRGRKPLAKSRTRVLAILPWVGILLALALALGGGYAIAEFVGTDRQVDENTRLIERIQAGERRDTLERAARVDADCTLNELSHKRDVDRLRQTYEYLAGPEAAKNPGLTRLVVQGEPAQREQATIDQAPNYCDELGVGLPEPDPVIPARPRAYRDLLPPLRAPITPKRGDHPGHY